MLQQFIPEVRLFRWTHWKCYSLKIAVNHSLQFIRNGVKICKPFGILILAEMKVAHKALFLTHGICGEPKPLISAARLQPILPFSWFSVTAITVSYTHLTLP